ncbi:unnamed protein product [Adineta ricciae]|uniref:peptide-O-fucosyltransferase n=1 Tax=Adineta ricciae TaxID=249248 RepID=A0A815R8E5_ADIRI|nr:unnamed protein product [Adineta ricciae]CAF1526067.1 unnamed protein product [Adineta ricciae]
MSVDIHLKTNFHSKQNRSNCNYPSTSQEYFLRNTSSHLPSNVSGAILWSFLYAGLTNQRMRMRNGILLAAKLHRPIIISPWIHSRQTFSSNNHLPWLLIPFTKVFDVELLISCLANYSIVALYPCRPDNCVSGFSPPQLTQNAIEHGENIKLPFVVANFDPWFINQSSTQDNLSSKIDNCFTWSCDVHREGQRLLQIIKNISKERDFSNIFGLHLRIENDFQIHIAKQRQLNYEQDPTVLNSITNLILTNTLNCFNKVITHTDSSQFWVYIATGETKNSTKMVEIRQFFPNMITKEDLSLNDFRLGMDFMAAIDSVILEELAFFIGFRLSTFSAQVARNRRTKGLKSALYTLDLPTRCLKL